ncbi:MAG: hypothetical protein KME46_25815 [Brasilonema angustatum HA4187-MV1]|nr:hypothetical protein [Brasilonema angustatum HA4187-MV1]
MTTTGRTITELKNQVYAVLGSALATKTAKSVKAWAVAQGLGNLRLNSKAGWMTVLQHATSINMMQFVPPSIPAKKYVADGMNNVYLVLNHNKTHHLYTVLNACGQKQLINERAVTQVSEATVREVLG